MARKKIEVRCPYCEGTFAASGMTSHVRHKHPEHYEEYKKDRLSIIEKNTVGAEKPAPDPTPEQKPVAPAEPVTEAAPEPEKHSTPASGQTSGSFLGSIGKALRDW